MNVINTGNREGARYGSHRDPLTSQASAPTSSQRHDALLEAIRAQCADYVLSALRTLFDKADDLLFDLARRSDNHHVKREYFEAMQAIHRQRGQMEDLCTVEFLSAFDQCRPRSQPPAPVSPAQALSDSANGDITREQLAIAFLIDNAERGAQEELQALNRRVGVLLGRPELPSKDNPAGPATMGVAVKTAMSRVHAGGFIRLLLYALFDRHVMGRLRTLYRTLNEFLIDQQVLPEILIPAQQPLDTPNVAAGDLPAAAAELPAIMAGNARIELSGLLSGANTPVSPTAVNKKLVEALTSLQRGRYVTHGTKTGGACNVLRDLKIRGLLPQMDQADDAKFDLVAMLFDYFLNDEQLPFALRDRIACLQIPLLKTAFIDNNFFVLKTHPARQLLNTITRIGVESAGAPASLAVLLDSVDRVVQRIHDEFSEDVSLFAVLQMQLERDTAIARHEVVAGGQCAVPAAPDQPRHEEAKRKIRTLIDSRLDHISPIAATIPEVVRNFILTHWQHLLIRHFIREGGNGDLLNEAIHTMDDLIRSTTTARNASDLLQLRQLRPVLIRRLETGMDVLALPSIARNGFLERLAKCHAEVLGPESDVNTGPETISEDASLAIAAALFEDVPPSMSTRPDPEEITTPREVYLKTAKAQLPPAPASSPSTEESGSKDIHMKL